MKVDNYEVQGNQIILEFVENIKHKNISLPDFESWLSDNGYMNWCDDSSDHNGEHVQSSGVFAGFEEWSLDKTNLDVIKVLEQYLNEQK